MRSDRLPIWLEINCVGANYHYRPKYAMTKYALEINEANGNSFNYVGAVEK